MLIRNHQHTHTYGLTHTHRTRTPYTHATRHTQTWNDSTNSHRYKRNGTRAYNSLTINTCTRTELTHTHLRCRWYEDEAHARIHAQWRANEPLEKTNSYSFYIQLINFHRIAFASFSLISHCICSVFPIQSLGELIFMRDVVAYTCNVNQWSSQWLAIHRERIPWNDLIFCFFLLQFNSNQRRCQTIEKFDVCLIQWTRPLTHSQTTSSHTCRQMYRIRTIQIEIH